MGSSVSAVVTNVYMEFLEELTTGDGADQSQAVDEVC